MCHLPLTDPQGCNNSATGGSLAKFLLPPLVYIAHSTHQAGQLSPFVSRQLENLLAGQYHWSGRKLLMQAAIECAVQCSALMLSVCSMVEHGAVQNNLY